MSSRRSFTLQVQDSDGQSDSESRDYLPSNSRENQSDDNSESTGDGVDRLTDHQAHLSTSCQWLYLSCMTPGGGSLILIEIISRLQNC